MEWSGVGGGGGALHFHYNTCHENGTPTQGVEEILCVI